MLNFLFKLIVLLLIFTSNLNAETITVKCYLKDEKSYTFLFDTKEKTVKWLDQDNQNMKISIFPDVDKGGRLLIMGGTGLNNEKHTFIVDVVKSVINVNTNLGFKDAGKCGNKSIIEAPDPYEE